MIRNEDNERLRLRGRTSIFNLLCWVGECHRGPRQTHQVIQEKGEWQCHGLGIQGITSLCIYRCLPFWCDVSPIQMHSPDLERRWRRITMTWRMPESWIGQKQSCAKPPCVGLSMPWVEGSMSLRWIVWTTCLQVMVQNFLIWWRFSCLMSYWIVPSNRPTLMEWLTRTT